MFRKPYLCVWVFFPLFVAFAVMISFFFRFMSFCVVSMFHVSPFLLRIELGLWSSFIELGVRLKELYANVFHNILKPMRVGSKRETTLF